MKYIICDDEEIQRELLTTFIRDYASLHDLSIEIIEYKDANNLWWDLQNGIVADLIFLDIMMTDMTGIELAKKMREAGYFHQICFVTGVKEFVFEGYDVDAISYILKPFNRDQLFSVLDKAVKLAHNTNEYSIIKTNKELFKIYHNELIGMEALGHDTKIYLKGRNLTSTEMMINLGISQIMDQLSIQLFQTHRSYAINMANIDAVNRHECVGCDQTIFPIARGKYEACMQAFIQENRGQHA